MFKWLHHLLNPHCSDCQLAAAENKVCVSCETLKMQLSIANIERRQMLESILAMSKPTEVQSAPPQINLKEAPKPISWNVRKQMLEAEDRKQAIVLAEQKKFAEDARRAAQMPSTSPLTDTKREPTIDNNKPIEDRAQSIEQLERELNIDSEAANA